MAYIVRLENDCGSGSPSVIREDGTRVDRANSYESSGVVSVFLDQGSCGPLGENCSTVRVNESGRVVGSSSTSVPIALLYSGEYLNPTIAVADHLTVTFCPAVPTFVDQRVPPRFRRLVSRQVSETLWTPIVIASICGSFAVLLLFTMIYMWRSKVPEPPMMIDSRAHPPLTPLPPRRPPQSYIPKPRSQLFRDVKLFPAMHSEPMSVWED
ncbi:hypothetical protein EDD18DRAFT_1327196 [Armillaria luteobubalina]|uniref:Uncharacterized protein n=1 Tax=Armillaria luteobubalina TaxID=153913 RepID=A0AA39QLG1_9AGAR|nr:hypothetical protein EDD18DRAFT_1327196 [Armillaria luteobubalina]